MGYASGIASLFFQEESYGPVILVAKAAELRRLTHNWGIHAKQDVSGMLQGRRQIRDSFLMLGSRKWKLISVSSSLRI